MFGRRVCFRESSMRSEKEWQEFWKEKNRKKNEYDYSLKRTCIACTHPVTDQNPSGMCVSCANKARAKGVGQGNHSGAHTILKIAAKKFLREVGCSDIREEKGLGIGSGVIVDTVGNLGKEIVAIECGGARTRKLKRLSKIAKAIYIFPYGEDKPFLWNGGDEICPTCGHITRKTSPEGANG